jgi:hypothetical protein
MSIALPTFAQQQSTVDPEVRQGIDAVFMKFGEAVNKRDPDTIAALYTQEAVQFGRGRRRQTLWLPVSKPSRKDTQSC